MPNKKKKRKATETKVKDAKFIRFSPLQRKCLTEVRNRVEGELNATLNMVYEELGIREKIEKAPPGTYKVRMHDCSGVDVISLPPGLLKPGQVRPDPPKDDKPPEKKPATKTSSKEKGTKDH